MPAMVLAGTCVANAAVDSGACGLSRWKLRRVYQRIVTQSIVGDRRSTRVRKMDARDQRSAEETKI